MSNPSYAEDRSVELIRQAQGVLRHAPNPQAAEENLQTYQRLMTQAIGLLSLAKAVRA